MERTAKVVRLLQKSWNLTTIQPSFGGTCSHNLQLTRVVASAPYVANFNPAIKRRILYATFVLGPIIGTFGYYVRELGWKKVQVSLNGLARFGRSVKTGMTISMDYWWTLNYTLRKAHEESAEYAKLLDQCHQRAADRMYHAALKNGGIYVKLGQGLCAFNQLLPSEYVTALRPLEDKALDFQRNDIFELFEEEFQCSPKDMFQSFNPEPVAAASLALVFKATTKDGKDVAVKSQYIDLQDRFEGDIWCVEVLLKIVGWMHPSFNFSWILQEMKGTLAEELDFINEANNSERCKKDLAKFKFITVPSIHWDKTTKAAKKLVTAFGEQIFSSGFIHGDPHPGNVLVTRNKDDPSKVQLIVLDHGLYEKISKRDQASLCNLWKAIVWKDEGLMKKYSMELGIKEEDFMLFCEILIMRPIHMEKESNPSDPMTTEEYKYMLDMAAQRFDKIMGCLRRMPKQMILIFRNLNTVRCINHTLGSPADRFSILAQCAIRGSHKLENELSATVTWRKRMEMTVERVQLDVKLCFEWVKIWLLTTYLKLVHFVTRREELEGVIKELESL